MSTISPLPAALDLAGAAGPPLCVGVIPAAGLGTRLRPLTSGALPKEMLPVGRKLALERIVDELRAAGVTRIVFVLSPAKEDLIRRHFGDAAEDATFVYVLQPEMRGLGDAVLRARSAVGAAARFVVALGDAVFEEPETGGLTRRLWDATADADAAVGIAVQRVPPERISRYGVVKPAARRMAPPAPNSGGARNSVGDALAGLSGPPRIGGGGGYPFRLRHRAFPRRGGPFPPTKDFCRPLPGERSGPRT